MKEIAVIMMTYIIGYTKLTRQKESLVRAISLKHKEILHEHVSSFNGRCIHIFGDNSLSVFSDPAEAVKCSIEIQRLVKEEPIIPMRIALHYGEITTEGEDIFGDAINLTSRILEIAITNSILISDKVKLLLYK